MYGFCMKLLIGHTKSCVTAIFLGHTDILGTCGPSRRKSQLYGFIINRTVGMARPIKTEMLEAALRDTCGPSREDSAVRKSPVVHYSIAHNRGRQVVPIVPLSLFAILPCVAPPQQKMADTASVGILGQESGLLVSSAPPSPKDGRWDSRWTCALACGWQCPKSGRCGS